MGVLDHVSDQANKRGVVNATARLRGEQMTYVIAPCKGHFSSAYKHDTVVGNYFFILDNF